MNITLTSPNIPELERRIADNENRGWVCKSPITPVKASYKIVKYVVRMER